MACGEADPVGSNSPGETNADVGPVSLDGVGDDASGAMAAEDATDSVIELDAWVASDTELAADVGASAGEVIVGADTTLDTTDTTDTLPDTGEGDAEVDTTEGEEDVHTADIEASSDADSESQDAEAPAEDGGPLPLCPPEVVAACDDGDECNGFESCDEATGECLPGTPLCDDSDPCTVDICDAVQGFCDVDPVDCSDGNPCTDDACDSDTGECVYVDADCSDGDLCTEDWCAPPAGGCFWDAVACDDGDPCTDDLCEPDTGCVFTPKACEDDIACTADACGEDGACEHTPDASLCDDGVACTDDSCLGGQGCLFAPNASACDDGDLCTGDTCDGVVGCTYDPLSCDDGLLCTVDGCESATGQCVYTAVVCDNQNACDGLEVCDPASGQCVDGAPVTCPDDDACDGVDSCDPDSGACVTGPPVDCYAETPDWDGCDGVKVCAADGSCDTVAVDASPCPTAPDACDQSGGVDGPQSGKVTTGPGAVFVLRDQMQWTDSAALVDQIEDHWSVTGTSIESVVTTDLNRQGGGISLDGIDCFDSGFWWNDGDNEVDYWWPQGVTGSSDAWGGDGKVAGKRLLVVSWYHKAEEDSSSSAYKGVRLAIVDLTTYDYRLVLLAEPVCDGAMVDGVCDGLATYEPLASSSSSLHAGGIVWYQNYLYVADTSHGFRVFDMSRIQRVQTGDSNALGYKSSADAYYAYNYRYVIPQVGRYQHCGDACCARFSFVSLDPTTSPPSLLAGEYVSGEKSGRAHRWSLDTETGRLLTSYKTATSVATYYPAVENMQGALSVDGHYFFSSSAAKLSWPPSLGSMHDASLGGSLTTHQWPQLPEDLYYEAALDRIWTCTEKPASLLGQTRYCFRVTRSSLVNNTCD